MLLVPFVPRLVEVVSGLGGTAGEGRHLSVAVHLVPPAEASVDLTCIVSGFANRTRLELPLPIVPLTCGLVFQLGILRLVGIRRLAAVSLPGIDADPLT